MSKRGSYLQPTSSGAFLGSCWMAVVCPSYLGWLYHLCQSSEASVMFKSVYSWHPLGFCALSSSHSLWPCICAVVQPCLLPQVSAHCITSVSYILTDTEEQTCRLACILSHTSGAVNLWCQHVQFSCPFSSSLSLLFSSWTATSLWARQKRPSLYSSFRHVLPITYEQLNTTWFEICISDVQINQNPEKRIMLTSSSWEKCDDKTLTPLKKYWYINSS